MIAGGKYEGRGIGGHATSRNRVSGVSGTGAIPGGVLAYGTKSVTGPRSVPGLRFDKAFALRDGVLTLRIPKAEQARPRRIDVRVE